MIIIIIIIRFIILISIVIIIKVALYLNSPATFQFIPIFRSIK